MRLFEKIICPVDFSENSVKALQWTEHLAKQYDSKVVLLHVRDLFPATSDIPVDYDRYREAVSLEFTEFCTALKIPYEKMISTGDPSRKIVALAKGLDASLIVMGTRGIKGPFHKLLGSTTEAVVRNSNIPVVTISPNILPPEPNGTPNILLPISSLQWPTRGYIRLRTILRQLDSTISLMHVIDYKNEMFDASFDASPFLVTTYQTAEKTQELLQLGMRLFPRREGMDTVIQFGDAAREILREVETGKYQYILMGARKQTLLSRFVDSTAYRVMSESKIPVFTIRVF